MIADRAGLTKSTFHRHFPDKRDVLAAGQKTLSRNPRRIRRRVAARCGGRGAARASGAFHPEAAAHVAAVLAASAELQERAALQAGRDDAAMAEALGPRAVVGPVARLAAESARSRSRRALPPGCRLISPATSASGCAPSSTGCDDRRAPRARRDAAPQKPGVNRYGRPEHVVDRDSPRARYSATSTIVASPAPDPHEREAVRGTDLVR